MELKPSQAARAIEALMAANEPWHLTGIPGIGKSSIGHQAASRRFSLKTDWRSTVALAGERYAKWFMPLDVVTLAPVDARGIPQTRCKKCRKIALACKCPKANDYFTSWAAPELVPTEEMVAAGLIAKEGLLLLDEYPLADREVQGLFRSLLLDHVLCGAFLAPGWRVGSTGNRVKDRAGAKSLLTHVRDALTEITVTVDYQESMDYLARAGVHEAVCGFLKWQERQNVLVDFDPARESNTTPRGWERVGKAMPHVPADLRLEVFSGMVLEGHASAFIGYLEIQEKLPDIKAMLAACKTYPIPREPSLLWALASRLSTEVRKSDAKKKEQIMEVIARMDGDFAARTVRDCMAQLQGAGESALSLFKSNIGAAWKRDNRSTILGDFDENAI